MSAPKSSIAAFISLAEQMDRVTAMPRGAEFVIDLMLAVITGQGLMIVDRAEYARLLRIAEAAGKLDEALNLH
jgi:hypothetical protein